MTPEAIATLCETVMIVCFGLSWPLSVYKSWKSRTAKGKSLQFELFIWVGYIFGMTRKILLWNQAQAAGTHLEFLFYLGWAFYVLNFVEISIDMLLYFRNTKLDRLRDTQQ